MTLDQLKTGEEAYITRIKGSGTLRKRLLDMGFLPGQKVQVIREAPLHDPIEFLVMNYHVSLRRKEAMMIEVLTNQNIIDIHLQEWQKISHKPIFIDKFFERKVEEQSKILHVALIGNPNCGKTTLFNFLTHSYEHVGNFAGITIDAKKANIKHKNYQIYLIDLPGLYSLTSFTPEEEFVVQYLLRETPDYIINVVDANTLERNLYLTSQLLELDIPFVIALNMWDEFLKKKHDLDYQHLSALLGVPIIPTIGPKKKGLTELLDRIIEIHENPNLRAKKSVQLPYPFEIEEKIQELKSMLENDPEIVHSINPQFIAVKLLEKDHLFDRLVNPVILKKSRDFLHKIEKTFSTPAETLIAQARYGFVHGALKETLVLNNKQTNKQDVTEQLDGFLTHKVWGYVFFVFVIWLMFFMTFKVGNLLQNYLILGVDFLTDFVNSILPPTMFRSLLSDGIIQGVGGVVVYFPNILILYFFIALIEDSGYLARIAFIMDKIMHKIGLHGKSFIPMMMGFGCNVPAIAATRILNNPSDRIITMLINPFFSCSARLPVYMLIISALFPIYGNWILFFIYMGGILMAIFLSIILRKTLFAKEDAPFVMELPPYRLPTVRSLMRHMWFRSSQFLKKMSGVILVASIILWALHYFPVKRESSYDLISKLDEIKKQNPHITFDAHSIINLTHNDTLITKLHRIYQEMETSYYQQSYLARIGKFIEPLFAPLQFNWQITTSLLAGLAGKEIVVSTLLITSQAQDESLPGSIKNLFTLPSALAFLVFILLYSPCMGVLFAIYKESSKFKWAFFSFLFSTILAYIMAFATLTLTKFFLV
ncbi:MAG: ferrous iron transport protein B [Bacteroidales bacterium]|nr:ferrous iron transport protein B [Bacteroidales bacterium]